MSSTQSSPGGEGDGVGEEDKFLKADKKENMVSHLPYVTYGV